jgi:type IV pilus assembly protein PilW
MNARGMTLVELLVTLVITSVITAGVYRVVLGQVKAYNAQEQVVELQQSLRGAMEQLVSDIRMAGYDSDSSTSKIVIDQPIIPGSSDVSLSYEYDDTTEFAVTYRLDGDDLFKQITVSKDTGVSDTREEILLDGVDRLSLSYGLDTNNDGVVESWVSAGGVTSKIIAIRVQLSVHPLDPDLKGFSSRSLESVVALRNRIL